MLNLINSKTGGAPKSSVASKSKIKPLAFRPISIFPLSDKSKPEIKWIIDVRFNETNPARLP